MYNTQDWSKYLSYVIIYSYLNIDGVPVLPIDVIPGSCPTRAPDVNMCPINSTYDSWKSTVPVLEKLLLNSSHFLPCRKTS